MHNLLAYWLKKLKRQPLVKVDPEALRQPEQRGYFYVSGPIRENLWDK